MPPNLTTPLVVPTALRPASTSRNVVLPLPLGPRSATISPGLNTPETSDRSSASVFLSLNEGTRYDRFSTVMRMPWVSMSSAAKLAACFIPCFTPSSTSACDMPLFIVAGRGEAREELSRRARTNGRRRLSAARFS
jgi:hypothetical protein